MRPSAEPLLRFVIGGAQKGGTSALARYLDAHPALCLPTGKEGHVFDAPDFDDAWLPAEIDARCTSLFDPARADALHGDATPFYLLHPRVVARIARYNPAMRWIVLLREPAERALSHHRMERSRGRERWPLWLALLLERWRLAGHHDDFSRSSPMRRHAYRLRGDYARQLDVLLQHVPRAQVLVLRSDHLRADPGACVASACRFLGVPPPPPGTPYPPVFVGDYTPPAGWAMRWLRWRFRRERRALARRHGIDFDA